METGRRVDDGGPAGVRPELQPRRCHSPYVFLHFSFTFSLDVLPCSNNVLWWALFDSGRESEKTETLADCNHWRVAASREVEGVCILPEVGRVIKCPWQVQHTGWLAGKSFLSFPLVRLPAPSGNTHPWASTVGLCIGPYGGPMGGHYFL